MMFGLAAVLFTGVFIAVFWSLVPISNRLQWTCAKTGSQKGKRVYFGLVHLGGYYWTSGLESFLIQKGQKDIQHEWVKTAGTERYVLATTHSHSKAPATYHFNYLFQAFMARASDEQKFHMMKVLLGGPEDARKAFLREAEQVAYGVTE